MKDFNTAEYWTGWCLVEAMGKSFLISPMFDTAKAAKNHWVKNGGNLKSVKAIKVRIYPA